MKQDEIEAAHARIAAHIRRTPIMEADGVSLKLECLQHTGSFKPRGAFNNLLSRAAPGAGVATASGGNHGAAVAYAARELGLAAKVFVPDIAAPLKIEKIRSYGADIHVEGRTYFDALALCEAHVAASGALAIHAYDSPETVAGQGTVGLEWERDLAKLGLPGLDTMLVAVGGGGLISGVAAWFAGRARVIGIEPQGSRALHAALQAGRPVDVEVKSAAADSLGARRVGAVNFDICRHAVERVALVDDAAISAAQRKLWRDFNIVTEPGGAAAYAALLSGAYRPGAGERLGVLVCGANADLATLAG
ncbi:MAG TPA: threonine/serine dehydratase [Roseiarcus sp.]|nr:threonine/serine dehydratase [Roseiarcus sp.]